MIFLDHNTERYLAVVVGLWLLAGKGYLSKMSDAGQDVGSPEESYWRSVSQWVTATKNRYRGWGKGELTQCFMRGPFAGWSERQVAELADQLSENALRFPLRGHEDLPWGDGQSEGKVGEGNKEREEDSAYCPVCQSCGEDGCCGAEKAILNHECKYAVYYAQQVYYDKMVIEEFHKLAEGLGIGRDETGGEIKDPIGDLYDRAWKRVEEKYGKA